MLFNLEWVTAEPDAVAQWDYGSTNGLAHHSVYRQDQELFSQQSAASAYSRSDQELAEWGTWYYATNDGDGTTYQSGSDSDVRGAFSSGGKLGNTKDGRFRAVNDNLPVFGFAVDLGQVNSNSANTLFSIGLSQPQSIQYTNGQNTTVSLPPLWKSYFSNDLDAVSLLFTCFYKSLLIFFPAVFLPWRLFHSHRHVQQS